MGRREALKNYMKNRRGEGYVDTVVEVLVFTMLLVLVLNVFQFLVLKQSMDYFAKELITTAAVSGRTSHETAARYEELAEETGLRPAAAWTAEYFNAALKQVQLGDTIHLRLTCQTRLQGFGVFNLPLSLTASCSGLSQRYWKGTG